MNWFYGLWLAVAMLFLALFLVAARSDWASYRRRRRHEWHADSHRSAVWSDQYGVGGGSDHPGSPNLHP